MKFFWVVVVCAVILFYSCKPQSISNPSIPGSDENILVDLILKLKSSSSSVPAIVKYKTYVTNLTYAVGSLGGISGADTICNADAGKPADGYLYKALLVDETGCGTPCRRASITANLGDGQIDWVFKPNASYYRADGVTLLMETNANAIFVFGTLTNSWTTAAVTGVTGIAGTWYTFAGTSCNNYSTTSGSVTTAQFNQTGSGSISGAGLPCTGSYNLLCVQQ